MLAQCSQSVLLEIGRKIVCPLLEAERAPQLCLDFIGTCMLSCIIETKAVNLLAPSGSPRSFHLRSMSFCRASARRLRKGSLGREEADVSRSSLKIPSKLAARGSKVCGRDAKAAPRTSLLTMCEADEYWDLLARRRRPLSLALCEILTLAGRR